MTFSLSVSTVEYSLISASMDVLSSIFATKSPSGITFIPKKNQYFHLYKNIFSVRHVVPVSMEDEIEKDSVMKLPANDLELKLPSQH